MNSSYSRIQRDAARVVRLADNKTTVAEGRRLPLYRHGRTRRTDTLHARTHETNSYTARTDTQDEQWHSRYGRTRRKATAPHTHTHIHIHIHTHTRTHAHTHTHIHTTDETNNHATHTDARDEPPAIIIFPGKQYDGGHTILTMIVNLFEGK